MPLAFPQRSEGTKQLAGLLRAGKLKLVQGRAALQYFAARTTKQLPPELPQRLVPCPFLQRSQPEKHKIMSTHAPLTSHETWPAR